MPLDHVKLPSRLHNWADQHGVATLQQLASIPPRYLLQQQHLGRRSVAVARAMIESHLGVVWEDLAEPPRTRWDAVRRSLSEEMRAVAIAELDLPMRVRGYAASEGLRTLGELAERSARRLRTARNLGGRSLDLLAEAVITHQARSGDRAALVQLGLFPAWEALLGELSPRQRDIAIRRAGLAGRAESRQAVAASQGCSGTWVRQVELQALAKLTRERGWLRAVQSRVDAALCRGAAPLAELAEDPWWGGSAARVEALEYFGAHLLGAPLNVVELDGVRYLARCSQASLARTWKRMCAAVNDVPLPAPIEVVRAELLLRCAEVGPLLGERLFERLRGSLHLHPDGDAPVVTSVGSTLAASLLSLLRTSPAPIGVDEVAAKIGRFELPGEVIRLGRGRIGLPRHFPGWDEWMASLVPAAVEVMERGPRDRQWGVAEIRAELCTRHEIPAWLDDAHLGSLLRRSGKVRYLGRLRVALLDASASCRLRYRDELVRILRERGQPMLRRDAFAEIRSKTSAPASALLGCVREPEILQCDAERLGLTERDLPGGLAARAEARDRLAALLGQRSLGPKELWAEVTAFGPPFAAWSLEMCVSILRNDPRFRLTCKGAVSLARRDAARAPTQVGTVRECLEEGGGRARVEDVLRRFEDRFGRAPLRVYVGALANRLGAGIRGEWIVRREEGDEAAPRPRSSVRSRPRASRNRPTITDSEAL